LKPPYEDLPNPHAWRHLMEHDDDADAEQARHFFATDPDPNEH
jgi:hypothetical protein